MLRDTSLDPLHRRHDITHDESSSLRLRRCTGSYIASAAQMKQAPRYYTDKANSCYVLKSNNRTTRAITIIENGETQYIIIFGPKFPKLSGEFRVIPATLSH